MDFLSEILTYFNLIVTPIYCIYRVRKAKYIALLNPSLHLVIWSYIYLPLAGLFMSANTFLSNHFVFTQEILQDTDIICNWFNLIFLGFYIISSDPKILRKEYKSPSLEL